MKKLILLLLIAVGIQTVVAQPRDFLGGNVTNTISSTNDWYPLVSEASRRALPQHFVSLINKLHASGAEVDTNINLVPLQWAVDLKPVKTKANLVFVLQHHPTQEEDGGLQIEMSQAAVFSFLRYLEPKELLVEGLEREVSTNKNCFIEWCNRDTQPKPNKEAAKENMMESIWGFHRYSGSSTNSFWVSGIEDDELNRILFQLIDVEKSRGPSTTLKEAFAAANALRDCLGMKILSERLRKNPESQDVAYIIGGLHGKSLRVLANELGIPNKSISLVFAVNAK